MVSFWPFKSDDKSAASFEKVLSNLSVKISKTSAQQDRFRSQQRRYKALWTLYTTFAYILVAAILTLVTGWDTWSSAEYTAVAGGPLIIYGVRTVLDTYYNYRLSNSQNHLEDLQKQRDEAIEKLKAATKYNSTQQLLDKYGGGTPPKQAQAVSQEKGKRQSDIGMNEKRAASQPGRTGFAPPPTANISRKQPPPESVSLPNSPVSTTELRNDRQAPDTRPSSSVGEEFAPNAFSSPSMPPSPPNRISTQAISNEAKWYDRILDVVLGEDETSAKNRIALICQNCRLVNGQAPPGTQTLEEIGRWRCSACHAMNGVESVHKKILQQMSLSENSSNPVSPASPASTAEDGVQVKEETG